MPVVVNLRPVTGLFGQRGAVAYDSSIIYDGLAVNIPALEQLEKVGEVAVEVADVAVDIPVLAQFERVGWCRRRGGGRSGRYSGPGAVREGG